METYKLIHWLFLFAETLKCLLGSDFLCLYIHSILIFMVKR